MWFSTEDATKESFLDIKKAYGSEVAHVVYTNSTKTILLLRTLLHKGPIVVFYIMLAYFGLRIVRVMAKSSVVSSTAKAQRHVVRVIVLQAIYPAILNVLPIFLVAFLNLFGVTSPLAPYFAAASFQLMPILNTLTIVFLIPSYRRAAISTIRPIASTTTNTVELISSTAYSR
ncbi:unnamed protein product [Bursaphelenchus xylophilus]|uniref:(pine wood nematode) hypothetical protein n=1 Tax=Bursaphelenchus xylophilus TaxID=6326 RepID=A0A1I7RVI3_BURXY|nr:unnamed protein product [Bursaphelenchus xylophilus]CAG9081709.1 unnamed protein product [Bursaphelenchus xylophilus]